MSAALPTSTTYRFSTESEVLTALKQKYEHHSFYTGILGDLARGVAGQQLTEAQITGVVAGILQNVRIPQPRKLNFDGDPSTTTDPTPQITTELTQSLLKAASP